MLTSPNRAVHETWAKRGMFYAGLAIFLTSFFLTAVGTLSGWDCALFSLMAWGRHDEKISSLAMFGGLINPQVILFSLLAAARTARFLRSLLAVTILFCIPITWVAIYQMSVAGMAMNVGPGHVLWIVGILLMVYPDIPFHFAVPKAGRIASTASPPRAGGPVFPN